MESVAKATVLESKLITITIIVINFANFSFGFRREEFARPRGFVDRDFCVETTDYVNYEYGHEGRLRRIENIPDKVPDKVWSTWDRDGGLTGLSELPDHFEVRPDPSLSPRHDYCMQTNAEDACYAFWPMNDHTVYYSCSAFRDQDATAEEPLCYNETFTPIVHGESFGEKYGTICCCKGNLCNKQFVWHSKYPRDRRLPDVLLWTLVGLAAVGLCALICLPFYCIGKLCCYCRKLSKREQNEQYLNSLTGHKDMPMIALPLQNSTAY